MSAIQQLTPELKKAGNQKKLFATLGAKNTDDPIYKKFVSAGIHLVEGNTGLVGASGASIFKALLTVAELDLNPSQQAGEVYIVKYKKDAQLQIGYKGEVKLLFRGGVDSITSEIVYEKDLFEVQYGTDPKIVHKPHFGEDKGEPIAVYATATYNGAITFKVLGKDVVMKFKNYSKTKNSQYSPWTNDPEYWMWRKTAVRQLAKLLPSSVKERGYYKALEVDYKDVQLDEGDNQDAENELNDAMELLNSSKDINELKENFKAIKPAIRNLPKMVELKDKLKTDLTKK